MDIDYDLENTPLEIKTDSDIGGEDQVKIWFKSDHQYAAGFNVKFSSPPSYLIKECTQSWNTFPTTLPPETNKVWRITLTRTSGVILVIHCNNVEVLNVQISSTTCTDTDWSGVWIGDIDKIRFKGEDTATDFYRAPVEQPGKLCSKN